MHTITERAVRSLAHKQGYLLRKSRSRTGWLAGTYMLVDLYTNGVVLGAHSGYGYDLESVADFLRELPTGP